MDTFLDFCCSCWFRSSSGCTFPCITVGHLGERVANTGEFRHPRFKNLPSDRFIRDLSSNLFSDLIGFWELWQVSDSGSMVISVFSVMEGNAFKLDLLGFPFPFILEGLSRATLIGEGKLVLFDRVLCLEHKRGRSLRTWQEEEGALEGDGGSPVPV